MIITFFLSHVIFISRVIYWRWLLWFYIETVTFAITPRRCHYFIIIDSHANNNTSSIIPSSSSIMSPILSIGHAWSMPTMVDIVTVTSLNTDATSSISMGHRQWHYLITGFNTVNINNIYCYRHYAIITAMSLIGACHLFSSLSLASFHHLA